MTDVEEVAPARGVEVEEARELSETPGVRRRGRSRARLRASIQRLEAQRRFLVLALVALGLAVSVAGVALFEARRDADGLMAAVRLSGRELARAYEQLAESRSELREAQRAVEVLVADRRPGLAELRLGAQLDVDQPMVRSATFESLASGLEVKLVVENDSDRMADPAYTVALFDEAGSELTRAQLPAAPSSLRPGEIRTFFATLASPGDPPARYFRVASE